MSKKYECFSSYILMGAEHSEERHVVGMKRIPEHQEGEGKNNFEPMPADILQSKWGKPLTYSIKNTKKQAGRQKGAGIKQEDQPCY